MKKAAYHLPITSSSIVLALASLGNLLGTKSSVIKYTLGAFALVFLVLILVKLFSHMPRVKEELKNPSIFSTLVTLTMGSMVLTTYLVPWYPRLMEIIWYALIVIQISIMIYFTYRLLIKNFDYKNIVPGWFVAYVGIGIVGVTAPIYQNFLIAQILVGFAFITYIIILPIVIKRTFIDRDYDHPVIATICIFAAPPNLVLTGYLNCFTTHNLFIVYGLWIIGIISFILAFSVGRRFIFGDFYPSLAALTFPFVISSTATNTIIKVIKPEPMLDLTLNIIFHIELFIAIFFVLTVMYRFFKYTFKHRNIDLI